MIRLNQIIKVRKEAISFFKERKQQAEESKATAIAGIEKNSKAELDERAIPTDKYPFTEVLSYGADQGK